MSNGRPAHFARWVFALAGIIGVLEVFPLYFLEATIGRTQPPPITHPAIYYGFVGVLLAWQIAFLIIARDPVRYVPLIPAACLEKLLYPLAIFTLYAERRVAGSNLYTAFFDLFWFVMFVIAWVRLRRVDSRWNDPNRSVSNT